MIKKGSKPIFAKNVRAVRAELRMNSEQFARAVGIHLRTLRGWEAGDFAPRNRLVRESLCRCADHDWEWFQKDHDADDKATDVDTVAA